MFGTIHFARCARRLISHGADSSSLRSFGGYGAQRVSTSPNAGSSPRLTDVKEFSPCVLTHRKLIHSGSPEDLRDKMFSKRENYAREGKDMFGPLGSRNSDDPFFKRDFLKDVISRDGREFRGSSQFLPQNIEQDADFVHIKLMRNNTFVTVTDSNGNKKLGASAGCLSELKGGQKFSRYAAEATAEHVGRLSRSLGIKSIVMRVKGFTYFKKKRQAIMSWKEGFSESRLGRNPIVYIEDVTRKAHNGCRLPKKRRI